MRKSNGRGTAYKAGRAAEVAEPGAAAPAARWHIYVIVCASVPSLVSVLTEYVYLCISSSSGDITSASFLDIPSDVTAFVHHF